MVAHSLLEEMLVVTGRGDWEFERTMGRTMGVHQRCIVLFTLECINGGDRIGNRIDNELQKISKTLTMVNVILRWGIMYYTIVCVIVYWYFPGGGTLY